MNGLVCRPEWVIEDGLKLPPCLRRCQSGRGMGPSSNRDEYGHSQAVDLGSS